MWNMPYLASEGTKPAFSLKHRTSCEEEMLWEESHRQGAHAVANSCCGVHLKSEEAWENDRGSGEAVAIP